MILYPGSKGWVSKYNDLLQKGDIILSVDKPTGISNEHFAHIQLSQSGIVFGYPTELLFADKLDDKLWTTEEKLKLLLFESHLFIYELNGGDSTENFDQFIHSLIQFYGQHTSPSITKMMRFFKKESAEEKIESILEKRTEIPGSIINNALWINYLSNSFVYLDVILYNEFLKTQRSLQDSHYEELAIDVLKMISFSSYIDGKVSENEKTIFDVYLASANINETRKKGAQQHLKTGAKLTDLSSSFTQLWMFKRFLLDISALTIYSNKEIDSIEKENCIHVANFLHLSISELDETLVAIEQFVLNHTDKIPYLQNRNTVEHLYDNISKRWIKILGRNKDKLINEIQQSKDLVKLIKKSTTEELSKEEKERVKTQFLDIVKTMPALAIFMLPGGAILLPIVLKIIPNLIPSAFRDNEIDS